MQVEQVDVVSVLKAPAVGQWLNIAKEFQGTARDGKGDKLAEVARNLSEILSQMNPKGESKPSGFGGQRRWRWPQTVEE